eukprot:11188354-Lingulodinium_polyedra.AAC.1
MQFRRGQPSERRAQRDDDVGRSYARGGGGGVVRQPLRSRVVFRRGGRRGLRGLPCARFAEPGLLSGR